MAEGKFYWLKLHRDFFKRHDIQVVESMPNGKDYILFYLKLLAESVDHEGRLRFSDTIPYNVNMLSAVTNTNVDVVKGALTTFEQLGMVAVLDDETIYMTEVQKMLGCETKWAEKKRAYRLAHPATPAIEDRGQCPQPVLTMSDKSKSKRESKSKNIFVAPTLEEVQAYCTERGNKVDAKSFFDYYEAGGWVDGKGNKVKNWKQKCITWEKHEDKPKQGKKTNQFNNMIHTDYDFDEIERRLLAK